MDDIVSKSNAYKLFAYFSEHPATCNRAAHDLELNITIVMKMADDMEHVKALYVVPPKDLTPEKLRMDRSRFNNMVANPYAKIYAVPDKPEAKMLAKMFRKNIKVC